MLESILDPISRALINAPAEDEEISEDEKGAVTRSREWFRRNEGIPFEHIAAECGFAMDQIYDRKTQLIRTCPKPSSF